MNSFFCEFFISYLDFLADLVLLFEVLEVLFFKDADFKEVVFNEDVFNELVLLLLQLLFLLLQQFLLAKDNCSIAAFQSWRELLAGHPAFFQM